MECDARMSSNDVFLIVITKPAGGKRHGAKKGTSGIMKMHLRRFHNSLALAILGSLSFSQMQFYVCRNIKT